MNYSFRLLSLPLAFLSVGCASTSLDFATEPMDALHVVAKLAIPSSIQLEADKPIEPGVAVGDSAVFSLRLHKAGVVKTWFIRVTVATVNSKAPGTMHISTRGKIYRFEMKGCSVYHVQVTDELGAKISESVTPRLMNESLCSGLTVVCRWGEETSAMTPEALDAAFAATTESHKRALVVSALTMENLFAIVKNDTRWCASPLC